jgi:outer membrane protein TolC
VDQTRVEAAALELAEVVTRIDDLTIDFQAMLDLLGFYTGRFYTAADTTLTMLADPGKSIPPGPIDPRLLPEVLALEEEIARKEKEYAISRKEMLPQFYLNGGFSMYGNDTTNVLQSLENLGSRDGSISLVAQWEIFSGFGDQAKSLRIKEEAARMNLEKEKRLAELSREIQTASHTYEMYQAGEGNHRERRSGIDKSRVTIDRLARQDIWDQVTLLENDIRLIEHELDIELNKIEKSAAGMKLKFWMEGQRS